MTTLEIVEILVRIAWLIGAVAFVIGLSRMNSPATARNGNLVSAGGMVLAIGATAVLILTRQLTGEGISAPVWVIIIAGIVLGGGLGLYTARTVKMTAMPQLVSLFNAVGGGAAALIAIDDYLRLVGGDAVRIDLHIFIVLDIIIGSITFTGSLVASGKLQGLIPGKPIIVPGGQLVTLALAGITLIAALFLFITGTPNLALMLVILAAALIFGVTMTLPIGGADMPVVISLLNSFTGTAVAMAGFVIDNPVLIIAGALVGASGAILTKLMADAMNRSVLNIMIGGFGGGDATGWCRGRAGRFGALDRRRRRRDPAGLRPARDHRAGLRPRRRPGPARRARAGRAARGARRGREVRDPSGGRADAGPHERAARRGERPVPPAQGDGRHQPGVPAGRRGPGHRRQRRDEPGRSPARARRCRACRSSTSTRRSRSSSSSARWRRGYAGIDNELYTNEKTGMLFADAKDGLASLTAAVKAL